MTTRLDETSLRVEMDRLRVRHRHLIAQSHCAPCSWVLEESTLRWHVVLEDALEPDIDIEQLPDALVVRARVGSEVREALVPVPAPFRQNPPRYVFRTHLLEIWFVV